MNSRLKQEVRHPETSHLGRLGGHIPDPEGTGNLRKICTSEPREMSTVIGHSFYFLLFSGFYAQTVRKNGRGTPVSETEERWWRLKCECACETRVSRTNHERTVGWNFGLPVLGQWFSRLLEGDVGHTVDGVPGTLY